MGFSPRALTRASARRRRSSETAEEGPTSATRAPGKRGAGTNMANTSQYML